MHVNSAVQGATLVLSAKKSPDDKATSVSTHLCTNTCLQKQSYILPIVAMTVSKGKGKFRLNCIFHTGSQRTYFCRQVIKTLGCDSLSSLL